MNRSKIEWCDHTLNIITGCRHDCPYCYAKTMARRFSGDSRFNLQQGKHVTVENGCYELNEPFLDENGKQVVYPFGFEPTFHKYRMNILDKHKGGKNFFVGAMADIFGEWVPDAWLTDIFDVCTQHKLNNYLFLTKNPARYRRTTLPAGPNFWYGTTITGNADLNRIDKLPRWRKRFLSIEPLLEDIYFAPEDWRDFDWIILGAETGNRKEKVVPKLEWINIIVMKAGAYGIPVFMKESLLPIVGEENMRREFPEELMHKPISEKRQQIMYTQCSECGKTHKRSGMVSFSVRVGRYDPNHPLPTKSLCAMCRPCYEEWCRMRGLENYSAEIFGEDLKGKEVANEEAQLQKDG